jgi:hypothetical protein
LINIFTKERESVNQFNAGWGYGWGWDGIYMWGGQPYSNSNTEELCLWIQSMLSSNHGKVKVGLTQTEKTKRNEPEFVAKT